MLLVKKTYPMSREQRIYNALFAALKPYSLSVENESSNHRVPPDSETHFKVVVVSNQFGEKRPVARHRLVQSLLVSEFKSGLHALSLHLYTPEEWEAKKKAVASSPLCQHKKQAEE